MLGKKSLAIALMGLGLAGSCFAAGVSNTVDVTFTATVQAATCPFSVNDSEGTSTVAFGTITKGSQTVEKTMVFKVDCAGPVSFGKVTIKGSVNSDKVVSDKGANFGFYSSTGGNSGDAWNAQTTPITLNTEGETTKYVRFESDLNTELGDHTANVVYTATYE